MAKCNAPLDEGMRNFIWRYNLNVLINSPWNISYADNYRLGSVTILGAYKTWNLHSKAGALSSTSSLVLYKKERGFSCQLVQAPYSWNLWWFAVTFNSTFVIENFCQWTSRQLEKLKNFRVYFRVCIQSSWSACYKQTFLYFNDVSSGCEHTGNG